MTPWKMCQSSLQIRKDYHNGRLVKVLPIMIQNVYIGAFPSYISDRTGKMYGLGSILRRVRRSVVVSVTATNKDGNICPKWRLLWCNKERDSDNERAIRHSVDWVVKEGAEPM